ncbi:hypothetical protein O987_12425 [Comamonas testosteroni TK102]|uniref:Uncharacterized protein n=1 Tax=Comamonas testosteroni TK102 TaxID=1392005 RepID=A0A076PTF0_COMTE|nr:hypothetical protein O987_12425 [Comamonas testosteroni TK102]
MNHRFTQSTSAFATRSCRTGRRTTTPTPSLIKMPPDELRQFNIVNSFGKPELWDVPIEIDPNTTGVMIAVDGTEMLLGEG